jgi:3-oxoacyl-[acyl-carrier protein] reductase
MSRFICPIDFQCPSQAGGSSRSPKATLVIAFAYCRDDLPRPSLGNSIGCSGCQASHVLANELGPKGIRVNSVSPGIVLTEGVSSMGMNSDTGFVVDLVSKTPLGRAGTPEDIADVVTFLATDDARW